MKIADTLAPLRARWTQLDSRERTLVLAALSVVGVALLWWIGISPALGTLRQADAQRSSLAAQVQKMQNLQAQAQAIQSQPKINRDEAMRALESSVKGLGPTAQLNVAGDRATVTLRNTAADALARWLSRLIFGCDWIAWACACRLCIFCTCAARPRCCTSAWRKVLSAGDMPIHHSSAAPTTDRAANTSVRSRLSSRVQRARSGASVSAIFMVQPPVRFRAG